MSRATRSKKQFPPQNIDKSTLAPEIKTILQPKSTNISNRPAERSNKKRKTPLLVNRSQNEEQLHKLPQRVWACTFTHTFTRIKSEPRYGIILVTTIRIIISPRIGNCLRIEICQMIPSIPTLAYRASQTQMQMQSLGINTLRKLINLQPLLRHLCILQEIQRHPHKMPLNLI